LALSCAGVLSQLVACTYGSEQQEGTKGKEREWKEGNEVPGRAFIQLSVQERWLDRRAGGKKRAEKRPAGLSIGVRRDGRPEAVLEKAEAEVDPDRC